MMQPSCPGLAKVTEAEFVAMTLRKTKILPMEKSKLTETKKKETDNIMGTVHKEFVLADQSILNTIVTFYSDCMNICKDFAKNFGGRRIH
jgi:uncharacterized protein YjfI (DUF2170 family)